MDKDFDRFLICLVEAKSMLWGKTLEIYKDRNETEKARAEIFKGLSDDFERNVQGDHITHKKSTQSF